MKSIIPMMLLSIILLTVAIGFGQVPNTLSYQGVLTGANGSQAPDGSYQMAFRIFAEPTGGSPLWQETLSANVQKGVFSVILGKGSALDLAFDKTYWLGITVEQGSELAPRTELTAAAYSLNARAISDSIVTANKIADGQVVRSLNGLKDDVKLSAGPNVIIAQQGDSLVIASTSGGGNSLWQVSGSNINYNLGNVGIGTANIGVFPGAYRYLTLSATDIYTTRMAALELQGGSSDFNAPIARIDFSSVAPSFVSNNIARIHAEGGNSNFNGELVFFTSNGTTLNEAMRINHNGNIGIGTNTPLQKLSVAGTVSATSFIGDGAGLTNLPVAPWQTLGNNIYYNDGNVGIGLSNPAHKLAVSGTVSAANFIGDGSGLTNLPNAGLALPYTANGNAADTLSVFRVNNSGSGGAISGINNSTSGSAYGLYGRSRANDLSASAVFGEHTGTGPFGLGVTGSHAGGGIGVYGFAPTGRGVYGASNSGTGVSGHITGVGIGVQGNSHFGTGVLATSNTGVALLARSEGTGDIFQAHSDKTEVFKINQNGRVLLTSSTGTGNVPVLKIDNSAHARGIEIVQSGNANSLRVSHTGAGTAVDLDVSNTDGKGIELTTSSTGKALDVVGSTTEHVEYLANIERTIDPVGFETLLNIKAPATGSAHFHYLRAELGDDIVFHVRGWGDVYGRGFYTNSADFAEMMEVEGGYATAEPGDVMVVSARKDRAIEKSSEARSTLVAGVYSTNPGIVGSERPWAAPAAANGHKRTLDAGEMKMMYDEIPLAVVGIVPCKVSAENGPIRRGDLLVTAATPGHAMRDDDPKNGAIVGKALGSLESGTGVIKVLVTLQ